MKKILFSLAVLATSLVSSQVLIDDTGNTEAEIHESAALQINSNDKGLLLPRLAEYPANAEAGLVFYHTTDNCLKAFDGAKWQEIAGEDCEFPPFTEYTISIEDALLVSEGEVQTFKVSIDPVIVGSDEVKVDFFTQSDTAEQGVDFDETTGTLVFNETTSNELVILVPTIADGDEDDNYIEEYFVQLSNPIFTSGYGAFTLQPDTALGRIKDVDSTPPTMVILEEDFSVITNGDHNTNSGSSSQWYGSNSLFPNGSNRYQAGGAVRIGTGSSSGYIESGILDFSSNPGTVTVTFDVKGWTSVEGGIEVSIGNEVQTVSYTSTMSDTFENKTVIFNNINTSSKLRIATTQRRAFIDNVKVTVQ